MLDKTNKVPTVAVDLAGFMAVVGWIRLHPQYVGGQKSTVPSMEKRDAIFTGPKEAKVKSAPVEWQGFVLQDVFNRRNVWR